MMRRSAPRRGSRTALVLAGLLALVAAVPGAAQAVTATKTINGSPLDVYISADGNLQAQLEGSTAKVFYPSTSDVGDAGFFLHFPDGLGSIVDGTTAGPPSMSIFGPTYPLPFESISAAEPVPTGSGYSQTTVYCVRPQDAPNCTATTFPVKVTQVVSYVNGRRSFDVSWTVENHSGSALNFRASTAADLYLDGSDVGVGYFSQGPPRIVGGINATTGRAGGIQEVADSPWDKHQEDDYDDIWDIIMDLDGPGFNNAILAGAVDNGVGVQWDGYYTGDGLANNATATFKATWQFGITGLTASPVGAALNKGATHTVTFTATDVNGGPNAGKLMRYTITGANPRSGALTTNGAGKAPVTWRGDVAGTDTVKGYLDLDGNGTRSSDEPQASATVLFKAPEAPIPTTPGNAFTFSGAQVFGAGSTTLIVVVPGPGQISVTPPGAGASAAAKKKGKGKGKKKAKKKPALIKKTTVNVKKAGPVKVTIKPTKAGKKVIKKKGQLKTKVNVTFTPTGGQARTVVKQVTIKKKVAKPKKKGKGGKGKPKKR